MDPSAVYALVFGGDASSSSAHAERRDVKEIVAALGAPSKQTSRSVISRCMFTIEQAERAVAEHHPGTDFAIGFAKLAKWTSSALSDYMSDAVFHPEEVFAVFLEAANYMLREQAGVLADEAARAVSRAITMNTVGNAVFFAPDADEAWRKVIFPVFKAPFTPATKWKYASTPNFFRQRFGTVHHDTGFTDNDEEHEDDDPEEAAAAADAIAARFAAALAGAPFQAPSPMPPPLPAVTADEISPAT
jgi:hypothetical protein